MIVTLMTIVITQSLNFLLIQMRLILNALQIVLMITRTLHAILLAVEVGNVSKNVIALSLSETLVVYLSMYALFVVHERMIQEEI